MRLLGLAKLENSNPPHLNFREWAGAVRPPDDSHRDMPRMGLSGVFHLQACETC
jgi:hypothetical protein